MSAEVNNKFEPYVKAKQVIPEVTLKAIILGSILSVVFGVANAYLGLKVGMTVCASIPAAVISMALLRSLFKNVTVLENNIVQTVGSAGESLAAGIIFTIPAFFIWNAQGFEYKITQWQIIGLSLLGGALGILLMIPLRKYLVEHEHGKLAFPEGTACAEIIVAGDEGGSKARQVFIGIGLGAAFKALMNLARIWPEIPNTNLFWGESKKGLPGANIGVDATPALLGVGYIIGPKIAALMFGGAVMGYIGIAPLLAYIGQQAPDIVIAPATIPLSELDPGQLRNFYIKYLGVGAVAFGGFVSLIKSLPVIAHSFKVGFSQLLGKKVVSGEIPRTDRDLPLGTVLIGSIAVVILIWLFPGTELHIIGAALAVLFGFFFVVVAARIVGIVGSSSSPVSGMTIATLLVTCLILIAFGVRGTSGMITAMSVGTVVCIAVCMSGDIAQDLKTGYLLGATPRKQQLTEFIGLLFPALVMGAVIFLLNNAFGFVEDATHPEPLLAPQANVMATVVQGVMHGNLPWIPIISGIMLAASIELVGISSLPFAIGLYLPIALSTPIMAGGILALIIRKKFKEEKSYKHKHENGILLGSGLVAGDALVGVLIAGLVASFVKYRKFYEAHEGVALIGTFGPWLSIICFGALILFFWWRVKRS